MVMTGGWFLIVLPAFMTTMTHDEVNNFFIQDKLLWPTNLLMIDEEDR